MKSMMIDFLNRVYEWAEWYGKDYKDVERYQQQAFGAVQFFDTLDESFDVSGEDRAYIRRMWENRYRQMFWELMLKKTQ